MFQLQRKLIANQVQNRTVMKYFIVFTIIGIFTKYGKSFCLSRCQQSFIQERFLKFLTFLNFFVFSWNTSKVFLVWHLWIWNTCWKSQLNNFSTHKALALHCYTCSDTTQKRCRRGSHLSTMVTKNTDFWTNDLFIFFQVLPWLGVSREKTQPHPNLFQVAGPK